MKRVILHVFAIGLVVSVACLSANAEPVVFSVTHAVRDAGMDITAKIIQQQVGIQTVPEPATLLLLGTALGGLVGFRARRRGQK